MAKEWVGEPNGVSLKFKREWLLNRVTNRFQLNYRRSVGPTSENVRKCKPNSLEEWEEYYYKNVRSKAHIENLGEKLFQKITTIIREEVGKISEEECIEYIKNLVINRVYEGYIREIMTVKELLEKELKVEILEAPEEWDKPYGVDYYIEVNGKYVGLQIKPETYATSQIVKSIYNQLKEQHVRFKREMGGKAFIVVSVGKKGERGEIINKEVIEKIRNEVRRLSKII